MAVFVGDNANNTLVGGSAADDIQGQGGNDNLNGGSGNDSLAGGTGNDTLTGSGGQDSFIFAEAGAANADTVTDFAGNWDSIRLDASALTALGAAGRFASGDVRFFAGTAAHDADDRIIYNSATGQLWYDADGNGSGAAQLIATLSNRAAVTAGDIWVFNGGGTPPPPPPPPTGQTINGTAGNDSLTGGTGNDTLSGNAGNDSLDGGAGNDSLTGGSGIDRFVFTSIGAANADVVDDFISGTDRLHLDARVMTALGATGGFASGDVRFFAGSTAHDADDRVIYNATTGDLFYDADGNGAGAAQLIANLRGMPAIAATDVVVDNGSTPPQSGGTAGNDSLVGTAGNDTLDALAGNDTLVGGAGNDSLMGGSGNDSLSGGDGNDTLEGEGGSEDIAPFNKLAVDTLNGGLGDDLYFVSTGDVLSDAGGIDTVVATGSWTLGAGLENLRIEGVEADASTGIGNELANNLDGRAEYVTLIGAGGDDVISGTNRVDSLDGGSGNDTIDGDGNYDTIIGGTGNDVLNGNGILLGGDGNDRLTVGFNDARLDGGAGNDTLTGGDFFDIFSFSAAPGAANADTIGGFGSTEDVLELDGNVFASIGASGTLTADRFRAAPGATSAADSSDRVIYNTTTGDLWYDSDGIGGAASVRFATLSGAPTLAASDITVINGGATGGTGQVINGTAANDSLTGTAGNDTINGLGSDDTIDGAAGNDTLNGGDGADRFLFGAAPNYGSDRIDGGAGFWADIVSFEGSGSSAVVIDFQAGTMTGGGTGGSGSAMLIGIEGAIGTGFSDRMTGSSTTAHLEGRGGNDTLIGGNAGGTLQGDTGDDSLVGGAAGDFLLGGQGRDTVLGGGGDDQFWGGMHQSDFVDGGAGSDTILIGESSLVTVDLAAGIMLGGDVAGQSRTTLVSIENVQVGAWSARITGDSASNNLIGNFQSDTLDGAAGNDFLTGQGGADAFLFRSAPGTANADVIGDFVSGTDKILLDPATYTAIGAAGNFSAGDARFFAGSAAHDADDRVVYNTATGQLWYDADGNGAGAAQLVATLQGAPAVAASDIVAAADLPNTTRPVFDHHTVVDNGASANRVDIVWVGDGFTSSQIGAYNAHVDAMVADMFSGRLATDPFGRYENFFNVHVVDVVSNQSGADRPGDLRDTALGAFFNESGAIFIDQGAASNAVADSFRGTDLQAEMRFAVVNDNAGGTGGTFSVYGYNGGATSADLALHEAGHSFAGLGDQYFTPGTTWPTPGAEPTPPDLTADPSGAKWAQWLGYDQPGIGIIGAYEGGLTYEHGVYRPSEMSKMRNVGQPFDAVGREQFVLKFYELVDPLDAWLANTGTLQNQDEFWVDSIDPAVISVDWTINGQTFVNAGERISLSDLGFGAGDYTVTARAYDPTDWVRIADRSSLEESIQWHTANGGTPGGGQVINGTAGNDTLTGGSGNDTLNGLAGNDLLDGGGGADSMDGGLGDDEFHVDNSGDVIVDAGGLDQVFVQGLGTWTLGAGLENLYILNSTVPVSATGNDLDNRIRVEGPSAFVDGRGGNDSINGFTGADTVLGGAGNDTIEGDFGNDSLAGGAGNDAISAGFGDDTLDGGLGNDTLAGDAGNDVFLFTVAAGVANADTIVDFATGAEKIRFDGTAFTQIGASGNFSAGDGRFFAGAAAHDADDRVIWDGGSLWYDADGNGAGAAQLVATLQSGSVVTATDIAVDNGSTQPPPAAGQTIIGTGANDSLTGGAGNDTMNGGSGNDSLAGGAGNDSLTGSGGQDTFVFREFGAGNADRMTDFATNWDRIQVDDAAFTAAGAAGRLASGDARFFAGTAAHDADDRFVFNAGTGQLYYDADGSGSGAAQLVATVQAGAGIAATDITVI